MQKARGHPDTLAKRYQGSHSLKAHGFRFYFTRLSAYFSSFPHGTRSLSVTDVYLALAGGPAGFNRDFTCPDLLRNSFKDRPRSFAYGAVTLYGLAFQTDSTHRQADTSRAGRLSRNHSATPRRQRLPPWHPHGLGCSPFARRY